MSYKPVMKTIGSKLRGLFSTSGQTVETALPNEIEVSSSGSESSGGVVTLYYTFTGSQLIQPFKNAELTESFSSSDEAWSQLRDAFLVKACRIDSEEEEIVEVSLVTSMRHDSESVSMNCYADGAIITLIVIDPDGGK